MVNCSYCDKELDRKVFCNASHKVMFSRGKTFKPKASLNTYKPKITEIKAEIILGDVCVHGKEKTWCSHKNCENYAPWR